MEREEVGRKGKGGELARMKEKGREGKGAQVERERELAKRKELKGRKT